MQEQILEESLNERELFKASCICTGCIALGM